MFTRPILRSVQRLPWLLAAALLVLTPGFVVAAPFVQGDGQETEAQSPVLRLSTKQVGTRTRVTYEFDGRSTARRADLREWLEGPAKEVVDSALVLDLAGAIPEKEIIATVDLLWSVGFVRIDAQGATESVAIVERYVSEAEPIVMSARVETEGRKLDPRTGTAWSGVGRYIFDDTRSIAVTIEGQAVRDRAALEERLMTLRSQRPKARLVLALERGVRLREAMWVKGIPERVGFPTLAMRVAEPADMMWQLADTTSLILDVDYDGRVTCEDEVLLEPSQARSRKDPYAEVREWYLATAPLLPQIGNTQKYRATPYLLRLHPSAPFVHVLRLLEIGVSPEVLMPRAEIAIAGRPSSEYLRIWQPVDLVDEPDPSARIVRLSLEVTAPGKRLDPRSKAAADGKGSFVWSEDRALEYYATSDLRIGIVERKGLLDYLGQRKTSMLILEVGAGVTSGDVYELLRDARAQGVERFSFTREETEPADDFR